MTINERYTELIKVLSKGNKRSFALSIGVTPSVIENVVGTRGGKPSFDVVEKTLYAFANINPTWLLTGKGEMLLGQAETEAKQPAAAPAAGNSELVAYLEQKLEEKTRECYDLQAKIEGLACELRRRKEAPAEEHPLADVG